MINPCREHLDNANTPDILTVAMAVQTKKLSDSLDPENLRAEHIVTP